MKDTEIDDRGLAPVDPADPSAPESTDAVCPECEGDGVLSDGEVCPMCQGTGRANARVGGG